MDWRGETFIFTGELDPVAELDPIEGVSEGYSPYYQAA